MTMTVDKAFHSLLADYSISFSDISGLKQKAQQYFTMLQSGEIDKQQYQGLLDDLKLVDETIAIAGALKNKVILEELFDDLRALVSLVK